MKKELPKIFQNKFNKPINNNNRVFHGEFRDVELHNTVDSLFRLNEIYRTNVRIKFKDGILEKKIIGRTKNNLITLDNEIIPISEIIEINVI